MREQLRTRTVHAATAQQQWTELLHQVSREETRVLVEECGSPLAAIVSAADLRRLEQMDRARQRAFEALEATGAAFKDVHEEELEREIDQAVAEVRAERRQQSVRVAKSP